MLPTRISVHDVLRKLRKVVGILWRTGVMRNHAEVLGREAKGYGRGEFVERMHLAVEPRFSIGAE